VRNRGMHAFPVPARFLFTYPCPHCMNHARHLQNLSHAVYPSVAQKDENLTAPDHDHREDGGAQSNQTRRMPPGFKDSCEGDHCRAEATCLLDSCLGRTPR
jgi:hypothetical protein